MLAEAVERGAKNYKLQRRYTMPAHNGGGGGYNNSNHGVVEMGLLRYHCSPGPVGPRGGKEGWYVIGTVLSSGLIVSVTRELEPCCSCVLKASQSHILTLELKRSRLRLGGTRQSLRQTRLSAATLLKPWAPVEARLTVAVLPGGDVMLIGYSKTRRGAEHWCDAGVQRTRHHDTVLM